MARLRIDKREQITFFTEIERAHNYGNDVLLNGQFLVKSCHWSDWSDVDVERGEYGFTCVDIETGEEVLLNQESVVRAEVVIVYPEIKGVWS